MAWAFQDAKAKLSEVVKKARSEGPQHVTVRGEPSVVVISEAEFERLQRAQPTPTKKTFIDHLLEGPPWPDDFVDEIINRPKDFGRDIDL